MLPSPEPVSRFFGFHLDLSLQVEVLPGWALDDAPNGDNGALGHRRHHHQQEHRKAFSWRISSTASTQPDTSRAQHRPILPSREPRRSFMPATTIGPSGGTTPKISG